MMLNTSRLGFNGIKEVIAITEMSKFKMSLSEQGNIPIILADQDNTRGPFTNMF